MKAVDIKKLFREPAEYVGKEIKVQGWIRTSEIQRRLDS